MYNTLVQKRFLRDDFFFFNVVWIKNIHLENTIERQLSTVSKNKFVTVVHGLAYFYEEVFLTIVDVLECT